MLLKSLNLCAEAKIGWQYFVVRKTVLERGLQPAGTLFESTISTFNCNETLTLREL